MRKLKFCFIALFIISCQIAQAQPIGDRSKLEQERKDLQNELRQVQSQYDKIKSQAKQSIGQLSILNRKIGLQEKYISNINKEIQGIDDDIYLSNLEIFRLQKQVDTLKAQYAKTVVYAYKNRSSYDYLNFIFSADNFNDAIRRISYLKSYQAYREKQVGTILQTQELIAKRKQQQLVRKDQKNVALDDQVKQGKELESQKKEKDVVVAGLKSQEKDLKKQIDAKKKRDNELKANITRIIQNEIAEAKRAEVRRIAEEKRLIEEKRKADEKNNPNNTVTNTKPNTPNTPNVNKPVTPTTKPDVVTPKPSSVIFNSDADLKLSASFEGNRSRLPWPVDNGFVKIHFGAYSIEGTLLKGDNPGITIGTQVGSNVKAVFEGEVVGVFNMGDGMAVTLKHGKYFTTYSNLTGVSVSKGATVRTGQTLGKAGRDDEDGSGQIDFILMIETKNVNPESWLHR